jgi:hypothetical protein
MKTVPLHGRIAGGRVALVDDADLKLVSGYRWWALEVRGGQRTYAVTQIRVGDRKRTIYMHQLITGWTATDHRNHDGLDNRRRNLRRGHGRGRNHANERPIRGGASRFKGVYRDRRRPGWFAQIKIGGRAQRLGSFNDEATAARAYDVAAIQAWGEYACVNFPDQEQETRS